MLAVGEHFQGIVGGQASRQGKQAQIKSIDRALNNATRAPSSAFHSRNHPLFIVLRHTTHTSTGA